MNFAQTHLGLSFFVVWVTVLQLASYGLDHPAIARPLFQRVAERRVSGVVRNLAGRPISGATVAIVGEQ